MNRSAPARERGGEVAVALAAGKASGPAPETLGILDRQIGGAYCTASIRTLVRADV